MVLISCQKVKFIYISKVNDNNEWIVKGHSHGFDYVDFFYIKLNVGHNLQFLIVLNIIFTIKNMVSN